MDAADRLVVLASAALTALVGGFRLGAPSLWFDEGFSLYTASGDLEHLLSLAADTEASGSLYYLLLRPWLALGQSEAALRSLALLFAVLTVPAFYGLARRLLDRATARIATPLFAVNLMLLSYAREVRGYSLALLLVTVSAYGLVRALDAHQRRWWALWSVAGALSIYAHLFAAFVLGTQALLVVVRLRGREQRRRALWATAILVVSFLPMAAFILTNTRQQISWIQPLGPRSFLDLARALTGVSFARAAAVVALGPSMALAGLGIVRLIQQARRRQDALPALLIPSWFLVPVAVAVALSIVVQPVLVPRYFIVIVPAYVLLLAVAISSLRHWTAVAIAIVLVVAPGLPSLAALYEDAGRRQDWRGAMATVGADFEANDAIAFAPGYWWVAVDYYAEQTLPLHAGPVTVYSDVDLARFRSPAIDYRATSSFGTIDAQRVWFITPEPGHVHADRAVMPRTTDEPARSPDTSGDDGARWRSVEVWEFQGLVLELLERTDD
jgi:mannosyltransferase